VFRHFETKVNTMIQPTLSSASSTASSSLELDELRQAQLYVDSIRHLNDEDDLEAGQLSGMSRILKNAEDVLKATKAALTGKP
jgi:hypothetical protein